MISVETNAEPHATFGTRILIKVWHSIHIMLVHVHKCAAQASREVFSARKQSSIFKIGS